MDGRFQTLKWHVVDGPTAPGVEASCESHSQEGIQGFREGKATIHASLVGFWSKKHKAIFTRHDSLHHTHVIVDGAENLGMKSQTGHVDQVIIPAGSRLFLPAE